MSDTILSRLIEKVLYPEAGSSWACRDWRTVSTLLDAAGEQASDAVMDLIGLLSDTAEEQQAAIARLTARLAVYEGMCHAMGDLMLTVWGKNNGAGVYDSILETQQKCARRCLELAGEVGEAG